MSEADAVVERRARPVRRRPPLRQVAPLLGPAFVASVAYVDPGNFATNITSGSKFGYLLLWVVVAANLMAMVVQHLTAKLGIATGRSLPQLCRERFPRRITYGLWVQAEVVAMATDLAEFVGAAIALDLLFGIPALPAGLITAVVSFGVLALQSHGARRFERAIIFALGVITLGFLYDTLRIGFDFGSAAGGLAPSFSGSDSVLLATGILGATVMPHVIYLHSALTQDKDREDGDRHAAVHASRFDVVIAMGLAGLVNMAMLVIAASLFHERGLEIDSIQGAYHGFDELAGGHAAVAFALALLASGLASSSVGTYAGQVIMQGFLARSIPMWLRRAITMAPALVVLAIGVNATDALVLSQVVLSFGIPFALIPLVLLTSRRDVMGAEFVNGRVITAVASVVATLIVSLNVFLLVETFA